MQRGIWILGALACSGLLTIACADEDAPQAGTDSAGETGGPTSSPTTSEPSGTTSTAGTPSASGQSSPSSGPEDDGDPDDDGTATDESSSSGGPPVDPPQTLCGSAPPDGAEMPPPLPAYSGGECPALVPGVNAMLSSGNNREFHVVVPSDLDPSETLPVAFLWHWLGGDAEGFIDRADVQNAVDQLRFIAIAPSEKGDLLFRWPFSLIDSDARMQEEFIFFDDMLACAANSYPVDNACVTSVGVSAGALFTSQLGSGRGDYLSSIAVLSGGTGGNLIKPWGGSTHVMPAMVLWGGPMDICIALNFEVTSADLESELSAEGHAVVECIHNCGHAQPPFEAPGGLTPFTGMWQFFLDHPYWLGDGESPWMTEGTPEALPDWCAVGVGSATPREGECPEPSAC